MHLHPMIAQLRGNWASQRRIQTRLLQDVDAWRGSELTRAVGAELARFARGTKLSDCTALHELVTDAATAMDWVKDLCTSLMDTLVEKPLGVVPFPSRQGANHATIQLMSHGVATLSLTTIYRSSGAAVPTTVLQVDRESHELLLRGTARGVLHRIEPVDGQTARIASEAESWQAGDQIRLEPEETRHLSEIEETLLVLQLSRNAAYPRPTREYRLSDGILIKAASGDKRASRDLLALAVMGAAEHRPALAAMGQVATDLERDPDVRWEAQRQLLALDTARGVRLLRRLAESGDDPLADAARSLHARLLATHPQLAKLDMEQA